MANIALRCCVSPAEAPWPTLDCIDCLPTDAVSAFKCGSSVGIESCDLTESVRFGSVGVIQGNLHHKKTHPPRTLP